MVVVTTSMISAPADAMPIVSNANGRLVAAPSAIVPAPVTMAPTINGTPMPRRSTRAPAAIAPIRPPMPMAAFR